MKESSNRNALKELDKAVGMHAQILRSARNTSALELIEPGIITNAQKTHLELDAEIATLRKQIGHPKG